MLRGMASARATVAPAQALERAMEIGDVALRRRTFDDVFWQLNRGQIDVGHGSWMSGASESALHAARAWLEAAKIPEDWGNNPGAGSLPGKKRAGLEASLRKSYEPV